MSRARMGRETAAARGPRDAGPDASRPDPAGEA